MQMTMTNRNRYVVAGAWAIGGLPEIIGPYEMAANERARIRTMANPPLIIHAKCDPLFDSEENREKYRRMPKGQIVRTSTSLMWTLSKKIREILETRYEEEDSQTTAQRRELVRNAKARKERRRMTLRRKKRS